MIKRLFLAKNDFLDGAAALLVFFVLLITSCASPTPKPDDVLRKADQSTEVQTAGAQKIPYSMKSDRLNAALMGSGMVKGGFSDKDYKIGPEDLLDISVFQADELKTMARVSTGGYIKLPLAGKVHAEGYTVSELETVIAKKLEKYLEDPVVSVFIREYKSQQISVLGAVKEPRVYYVTGRTSLLDVLSMAGGLTPDAGTMCIVQKTVQADPEKKQAEKDEKILVDLDQLLVNGHSELNVPLCSGDVVVVPPSGVFFVDGAVGTPGSFQLKGKITLTQAISMAKGLVWESEKDDIKIYRDKGTKDRQVIKVNYDKILKGKSPDLAINDKDIIIVPKNDFKSFLKSIGTGFRFGSYSLGSGYF